MRRSTSAPGGIDLKTKRGRQCLSSLGPFLLSLWNDDTAALLSATGPISKYFLYLVWRDGYKSVPTLSAAKMGVFQQVRQARATKALSKRMARVGMDSAAAVAGVGRRVDRGMEVLADRVAEAAHSVEKRVQLVEAC